MIQQIAPDNTLALSKDSGDTWRVPWKVSEHTFGTATVWSKGKKMESLPILKSTWKPWKDTDIEVTTHLVPPSKRWPDWHLRVHQVKSRSSSEVQVQSVQGGFSIQGRGAERGEMLPTMTDTADLAVRDRESFPEGTLKTPDGALICSSAGASGIRSIDIRRPQSLGTSTLTGTERPAILRPDANTNLMWQRTMIPTITSEFQYQNEISSATRKSNILVSAVFALARTSDREGRYASLHIDKLWADPPVLSASTCDLEHYMTFDQMG